MEGDAVDLIAIGAEGMDIAVAQFAPIDELDAELETALHRGQHFALVNFKQAIEVEKRRDSRFANPDRADFLGFDQGDRDVPAGAKPR